MAKRIMLVDDAPEILEVKARLLRAAGLVVEAYENPSEAILRLAEHTSNFEALLTDTEMAPFSGPALVTYISPKTNRERTLILGGSREVADIRNYRLIKDLSKVLEIEGEYRGKTILTSRQELKEQKIDDSLRLKGRQQLAVLNEALRISDMVVKIDSDGAGMGGIVAYLIS